MGGEVNITTRLIDRHDARAVLDDPEIYDRICDDFCPQDPAEMPWPEGSYAGGFVDGKLASVSVVHVTDTGPQFHFQVLADQRQHKRTLLRQALDLLESIHGSVWCEIPDLYPGVLKLAKEFGFREVEVRPAHYLKNGTRYDSRVLER